MHHITVRSPDGVGQNTSIELDGEPLHGVVAIGVDMAVGAVNRVTLTMLAGVTLEIDAHVAQAPQSAVWHNGIRTGG